MYKNQIEKITFLYCCAQEDIQFKCKLYTFIYAYVFIRQSLNCCIQRRDQGGGGGFSGPDPHLEYF